MEDESKKDRLASHLCEREPAYFRHLLAQFEFGVGDEFPQRPVCSLSTATWGVHIAGKILWTRVFSKRKIIPEMHTRLQNSPSNMVLN